MKRSLFLLMLLFSITVSAQKIAVKTNLLYDATTTLNLGTEFRVAPRWTIDLSGNYNPFSFKNDKKMKHWLVQPEARYWLCEAFNGHFFALHGAGRPVQCGQSGSGHFPVDRRPPLRRRNVRCRLGIRLSVCAWQPLEPGP